MSDLISRKAVVDFLMDTADGYDYIETRTDKMIEDIKKIPSAEPEIIRCKDCKHWTQSTGKMKGYGLGRCDFHDADLVTCNGFCYWAEGRTDG